MGLAATTFVADSPRMVVSVLMLPSG